MSRSLRTEISGLLEEHRTQRQWPIDPFHGDFQHGHLSPGLKNHPATTGLEASQRPLKERLVRVASILASISNPLEIDDLLEPLIHYVLDNVSILVHNLPAHLLPFHVSPSLFKRSDLCVAPPIL